MTADYNVNLPPQVQEVLKRLVSKQTPHQSVDEASYKNKSNKEAQQELMPECVQPVLAKIKAQRLQACVAIALENLENEKVGCVLGAPSPIEQIIPPPIEQIIPPQIEYKEPNTQDTLKEEEKWLSPENLKDTAFWYSECPDLEHFELYSTTIPALVLTAVQPLLSLEVQQRISEWIIALKEKNSRTLNEYLDQLNWTFPENLSPKTKTNQQLTSHFENKEESLQNQNYILIQNDLELEKAVKSLVNVSVLGIDLETTGLDPHRHKIRLIQIAAPNQLVIIDLFKINNLEPLKTILQGNAIKIGHNLKFDWKFLKVAGLSLYPQFFDTQIAHQLLTAGKHTKFSLKDICLEYLGVGLDKEAQKSDWSGDLSPLQLNYAAQDVALLFKLRDILKAKLKEANLIKVAKIEFDCLAAVGEIELSGMLLDEAKWQELAKTMEQKKQAAALEVKANLTQSCLVEEVDSIDLESPKQVLKALQTMGIPVDGTSKQKIAPLAGKYPVVAALLAYRTASKAVSAFGATLPKHIHSITGRIHPDIWQLGAVSGRFSCSNPNLQQIPRTLEVRSCFIPIPGSKLVIADYSQIELRIAAEISGDRTMIEAYQQGADLHKLTASLVLDKPIEAVTKADRQIAKSLNFGLVYGMSATGLQNYAAVNYGVTMTQKEAEKFRAKFFAGYKGLASWHKREARDLYNNGKRETRTLSDRRRVWEDKPSLNEVLNMPVQGTSADITKLALANLPAALEGMGVKIIAVVHDEIILEAPEDKTSDAALILEEIMIEAGMRFLKQVPVEVEVKVCESWGDK